MVDLHRDTIPEEKYGPFDAGWDARLEDKRMSVNPWAINNWKHYDWDKGWVEADETDKDIPTDNQSH
ncbi:MAG: hypothetical protein V3T17_18405 [Pseudomonadales bacterium]